MRTVNEVAREVLANPEAWKHAFPVSAPEIGLATHGVLSWQQLADGLFNQNRAYFMPGNFRRGSVASRILDRNSYNRPPLGSFYSVGSDNPPSAQPRTATQAMILEATKRELEAQQRRLEMTIYGDGPEESPARPDHHRVHPGRCACGFESVFQRDMEDHLADTIVESTDGVFRRWRVCESCHDSALCREVVVVSMPRLTFIQPDEPPTHWPVDHVYRCDNCTRGL